MGKSEPWAVAALVWNAFIWGLSWWPFRALREHGVHALWTTALVYGVSMIALVALRPGGWRAFGREPLLWLLAAASGFTNVGFNWGVTVGDVVRVVLLFYLMPAWSALLAWPLLGERLAAPALLRLAIALLGLGVVLKGPEVPWPVPQSLADWLALGGGFSFALTNVLLRKLRAVEASARALAMFGGGTAAAGGAGLLGFAAGVVPALPAVHAEWAALALALALAFLTANLALQYGAARVPAQAGSIIMLSEVLFATFSSVALGAAVLTPRTLLGGALILGAAAWAAWPSRRRGTFAPQ